MGGLHKNMLAVALVAAMAQPIPEAYIAVGNLPLLKSHKRTGVAASKRAARKRRRSKRHD